jgi:hypothetical protein
MFMASTVERFQQELHGKPSPKLRRVIRFVKQIGADEPPIESGFFPAVVFEPSKIFAVKNPLIYDHYFQTLRKLGVDDKTPDGLIQPINPLSFGRKL